MSKSIERPRSAHEPIVRDGLCRNIRSKGMILTIDEDATKDTSFRARYLATDPNALPFDTTIWWCEETSKSIGPDDGPCDRAKCVSGRGCYEP